MICISVHTYLVSEYFSEKKRYTKQILENTTKYLIGTFVLLCMVWSIDIVVCDFLGDIQELKDNIEWDVEGFNATRKVSYFGCCPEPFPGTMH